MDLCIGVLLLVVCSVGGSIGEQQGQLIVEPIDMPCPIPICRFPGPCTVPYEVSVVVIGGKRCEMCQFCPEEGRSFPREPVEPIIAEPIEIPCPIPRCLDPGPCSVPYEVSSAIMNGKRCEMCAYCPEEGRDRKRRTSQPGPVRKPECPVAQCYPPGPCKQPLRQSYSNGCPTCLYCPSPKIGDLIARSAGFPGNNRTGGRRQPSTWILKRKLN